MLGKFMHMHTFFPKPQNENYEHIFLKGQSTLSACSFLFVLFLLLKTDLACRLVKLIPSPLNLQKASLLPLPHFEKNYFEIIIELQEVVKRVQREISYNSFPQ